MRPGRTSPPARCLVLLLSFFLGGCDTFALDGGRARPRVRVQGERAGRTQTLAAAALPPDADLSFPLEAGGARNRLVLQYAWIGEDAALALLAAHGLSESAYSKPVSFAVGETVEVEDAVLRLHLVAHDEPGGRGMLEVSALAQPPDRGLLPVIRGRVRWGPSYHLVLRGRADDEPAFTTLLALRTLR